MWVVPACEKLSGYYVVLSQQVVLLGGWLVAQEPTPMSLCKSKSLHFQVANDKKQCILAGS